ncbi:pimeloyl-ACP methyl ester carboxylesterase [Hymenobacter luteus]|uniref:Pimeloyl-ACP methyl ester carboxylesterase n=2 Tax=Hymenobacter TaxID=89966 RepID=A0A7W9T3S3_9BACT|nr:MULTISPECIES: alpha/beta hydrolase [Hymenobacter]MBB4603145.1 pimeloyl-ACP methyl ester carboxylesterase [Hymenobacter latericoloratus]MBB6060896.1 pimeloyl-ACP methyl ester carboxylesterase [Hymenobacter luteus]
MTTSVPGPPAPARYPSPPPAIRYLRLKFRLLAAISTELAFGAAWKLFTSPRRLPEKKWEPAALVGARHFGVATARGHVAAYEWNPAGHRTVLLVHGWEHRASFWGYMARELAAAGFRVVALDAPAHGASAGTRVTLPAYARAVEAVADELGEVYGVVAHSLGGAATAGVPVRFNKEKGGVLPRLVLLAVPGSTTAVARRFAQLLQLPAAVVARMNRYVREQHGRDAESFSLIHTGRTLPVGRALLLHDHDDESIPFAEAQEIAVNWPGLNFRPTTGLGHNRIMRDPAVIRQVTEFLA